MSKYLAFVKVAEYRSFTKAAESLNYTQSAVSQMIRSLENELQTPLFHRTRNGLKLTESGEELLPYAETIVKRQDVLEAKAEMLNSSITGICRIGLFATFAGTVLPEFLKWFQTRYPDVLFELHQGYYSWIWDYAEKGSIDFAIVDLSHDISDEYDVYPLFEEPILLAMPDNSRFHSQPAVLMEQLNGERMLCLDGLDPEDDWPAKINEYGVTPDFFYQFCDNQCMLSAVKKGLGMALVPELGIRAFQRPILYKRTDPELTRSIGIVCKKHKSISPASSLVMKELIRFVKPWTEKNMEGVLRP
ncbi:MAG: LysR family transcriptional regulator [Eubacteriales bacterium]|nr:LysR family transcriptional regulator [Eubacteriales bacterium]